MARKKDLSKNGASYKILEYAFFAGSFTVKQANLSLDGVVGNSVISFSIKELYDRRYIKCILANGKADDYKAADQKTEAPERNRKRKYYTITEEGIRHLGKNSTYHKAIARFAVRETSLVAAMNKEERMNAYALARGAGFNTFTVQKPSFENLLWILNDRLNEPEEFPPAYPLVSSDELPTYLKDGIYYTSAEVRRGLAALDIDNDTFLTTRFTGLIINEKTFSLVYNYYSRDKNKGYMILYRDIEMSLINTLCCYLPGYHHPSCILLTNTLSLAASICIGHKNGRVRFEEERNKEFEQMAVHLDIATITQIQKKEEARQRRNKGYAISARRESKLLTGETTLFPELYVVPVKTGSTVLLSEVVRLSRHVQLKAGFEWFESHPGFNSGITENSLTNGTFDFGRTYLEAAYLPVIDCKILTQIRNYQKEKLAVVTRPEMAATISHILGTKAERFFDLTGKEILGVPRYKDTGYPVGEDPYAKLTAINKTRNEQRWKNGNLRKKTVSFCLKPAIQIKIRTIAKDSGRSMSDVVNDLLEVALTQYRKV